jgi:uncharacterized protein (DUF2141 family)
MRFNSILLIITLVVLISVIKGQETVKKGELTIMLKGFENNDGMAMIALSDSKEDFEAEDEPYQGNETVIIDHSTSWTISNLQFGEYAVKVFHDEDDDGEMDTNFFGAPSEDYGFSNDARGSFGPASWEDAKFLFNSSKDTIYIKIE